MKRNKNSLCFRFIIIVLYFDFNWHFVNIFASVSIIFQKYNTIISIFCICVYIYICCWKKFNRIQNIMLSLIFIEYYRWNIVFVRQEKKRKKGKKDERKNISFLSLHLMIYLMITIMIIIVVVIICSKIFAINCLFQDIKECTMNHKTDTFSNYYIVLEALFPTYKYIFTNRFWELF